MRTAHVAPWLAFGLLVGCSTTDGGSAPATPVVAEAPAPAPGGDDAGGVPSESSRDAAPAAPPRRSAGCGRPIGDARAGEIAEQTIVAARKSRTIHVALPAAYDAEHAYALVFVLHGAGDTSPADMQTWFPVAASFTDAIYVYPQALPRTRSDGTGDDVPRWDLDGDEDLALYDATLASLSDALCIDRARVLAAGFSSGGNFAQQLGCLRSQTLRAFATVAGPGPFTTKCGGPMPVWMTHDVDDDALPVQGARDSRDFWASHDACGGTFGASASLPPACTTNPGCPAATPLVYCETKGVGHDVPPFAPKAIADFFASFR